MFDQITPIILTYNEAPNIGRALEKLFWASDILVVDSFSTDETLQIASAYPQVRIMQRAFDTFADQCNYGLREGEIRSDWVLSLDADYILTDEFIDEISKLQQDGVVAGYRARFDYCVYGKRLRSGIYPSVTVLFRKIKATYHSDGHAHRVEIKGEVADLHSRILHDDRKPLSRWFQSQRRYAELESQKLLTGDPAQLSWSDRIRRFRVVAPPAILFYCLVVRLGILDGWAGFYYAFQRTLAELMLSVSLLDKSFQQGEKVRTAIQIPDQNSQDVGIKHIDPLILDQSPVQSEKTASQI